MINNKIVDKIVEDCGRKFPTFGGGKITEFNPISRALKDNPPMFAAGVDVLEVVEFVIDQYYANRYVME